MEKSQDRVAEGMADRLHLGRLATIEEGMAFAREAGFGTLTDRGLATAQGIRPEAVYAGFSFGVMVAQQLAQTRPGARGALLMSACLPVSEFGDAWPTGIPV
jgi:hypothetical protein